MKNIILSISLFFFITSQAQELSVKSFEKALMDIEARSNIVKDTIIFSIVLSSHDEDFTTSPNSKQIAIYKEYHMALAFVATLISKSEYYQCKIKQ